ncbi:MAG: Maf family protein [Gammaproteobacteria bacterium]|nr:Maf family protein [Gammaproteobacteria bacterium]
MAKEFIYLASASPRRSELLDQIGVRYRTRPADLAETRLAGELPADYVQRLAAAKADEIWRRIRTASEPAPVLAADTTVVVDDDVLGKPADEAEALAMLARLSGRSHRVMTAIAVRDEAAREVSVVISEVRFRATTATERLQYCRSGEPYDKAGGYAIQGLGAVFIDRLEGSYSAVMGLPLYETATMLRRFGLPAWLEAPAAVT